MVFIIHNIIHQIKLQLYSNIFHTHTSSIVSNSNDRTMLTNRVLIVNGIKRI